jgi:KUP system potassium uptake protein
MVAFLTTVQSHPAFMAMFGVPLPDYSPPRPPWSMSAGLTKGKYIGQAAYISDNPSAYSNPFYHTVPPGTFYPSLVVAILAAVVASQTMITATFQVGFGQTQGVLVLIVSKLLSQITKLSYFPQIKLMRTSTVFHGQIYIPWANWLLMIGTVS